MSFEEEIMDKEKKNPQQNNNPNKVAQLPVHCRAEGCKKKLERADFCNEHFLWFKAGLIKKDGTLPKDFDKKYIQYIRRAS